MKKIILILGLFLVTLNITIGKDIEIKTIEDARMDRFSKIDFRKPYRNDTDTEIVGDLFLLSKQRKEKTLNIQKRIKQPKQQPTKFKSTYLDFTILNEENIS